MNSNATLQSPTKRTMSYIWWWTKRVAAAIGLLLLLYAVIVLIGLVPVNNDFRPAEDGIEIWLISNPVHADLILPIETDVIDWRDALAAENFASDVSTATHVAIGWGDKGFFIHTPTWDDLRFSTAAHALLWPSESCLHVAMTDEQHLPPEARSVKITREQYTALVEFINASFEMKDGKPVAIPGVSYHHSDAFYEAHGTYHGLNTCNSWIGRAMRTAGIRTPWLTPLPKTVFLYLPD